MEQGRKEESRREVKRKYGRTEGWTEKRKTRGIYLLSAFKTTKIDQSAIQS